MKKIGLIMVLLVGLVSVTGCAEQTEKMQYVVEVTDSIPELTRAYSGMQTLYTSPLSYTTEEWVTEFRANKTEIEEEYNDLKDLTPLESLTDAHNSLLSVLETSIEANNVVDEQIRRGEELDFNQYLAEWGTITKTFEDVVASIGEAKEIVGQ